ncbi:hypothetical protein L3X38_005026 [Prunus dulcis]|uniref:Uncharacterized protein n=1 Tax=Prunus dulcis TaxID=3755 RepID=A0AAD4ZQ05_PRUDU|nr:hypothetical protein L3X38_005026 [Prunus dulcis]
MTQMTQAPGMLSRDQPPRGSSKLEQWQQMPTEPGDPNSVQSKTTDVSEYIRQGRLNKRLLKGQPRHYVINTDVVSNYNVKQLDL